MVLQRKRSQGRTGHVINAYMWPSSARIPGTLVFKASDRPCTEGHRFDFFSLWRYIYVDISYVLHLHDLPRYRTFKILCLFSLFFTSLVSLKGFYTEVEPLYKFLANVNQALHYT